MPDKPETLIPRKTGAAYAVQMGRIAPLSMGAYGIHSLAMVGGDPHIRAVMRAVSFYERTSAADIKDPYSDKKGRYHITSQQWKDWTERHRLNDEDPSPLNQDYSIYLHLESIGINILLLAGKVSLAKKTLDLIWPSLQKITLERFATLYRRLLAEEKSLVEKPLVRVRLASIKKKKDRRF